MCFRRADVTDSDMIAAVHVASWRETYRDIIPGELLDGLSVEARAAMWRSVLSGAVDWDGTSVFLAESGTDIVGFGACGAQRDENLKERGFDAEIGAIYVLAAHQRTGVGKGLMQLMARSLLASGRQAASLWVIRENAHARAFYEELGGALLGERVEDLSGTTLIEVGYGWRDLIALKDR